MSETRPTVVVTRLLWVPLVVFAVGRLVDVALILWLGHHTYATRLGLHGYGELVTSADGGWYRLIAEHGYPTTLPTVHGHLDRNAWVFFPLYPALVRCVMALGLGFAAAASVVSLVCGAAGMTLVFDLLRRHGGTWVALTSITALSFFPAAASFQMAYTEGLALLLVGGVLQALDTRRYPWAALCLVLLGLTRPIVLAFAPVLALSLFVAWRRRHQAPFPRRDRVWLVALTALCVASFALWPVVTGLVTGRVDAYVASQRAWLGPPGSEWASWWRVGFVDGTVAIAVGTVAAVAAAAVALGRRGARAWGTPARAWAASYFVYLLLTTRTTSSIFRYAMLALVPWWPVPEAGREATRSARAVILTGIVLIGTVLQVLWIAWVVVAIPTSLDYP